MWRTLERSWIKYGEEYNCALISIEMNGNMTLQETGERLGISAVRVKQIQDKTLKKIKIRNQRKFLKELKDKKIVNKRVSSDLRSKAKGGFFRSKRHIKIFLEKIKK